MIRALLAAFFWLFPSMSTAPVDGSEPVIYVEVSE